MLRHTHGLQIAAIVLVLGSTEAAATLQRTFVASTGADANPCSLVAPCRSFGAAITQTSPGGEVIVLDSAGYGPFVVSKSVSVTAPAGIYAGITVFSGTGIDATAGFDVSLRGLTINGQGGAYGIEFTGVGNKLIVDRCDISNMTSAGIKIDGSTLPLVTAAISNVRIDRSFNGIQVLSYATVTIVNSQLSYNGDGVRVQPTTWESRVSIDRSTLDHNTSDGVAVGGTYAAFVTISGSELDANFFGVNAFTATALVYVTDSRLVGSHSYGVIQQNSSNVVLSGNLISTNGASGVENYTAGHVYTMKNNTIRDNALYNLYQALSPLTLD